MSMTVTASYSQLDVKLGGQRMPAGLERALAEIEVENNLFLPHSFTLRFHLSSLDDALFDTPDDVFGAYLGQGTEVKISQRERGKDLVIMDGEVTSVGLEFSSVVPSTHLYAVVQGYDRAHRLHRSRYTRTFQQKKYSDVISTLVNGTGLTASVDPTTQVFDHLVQANQTNWEFLWHMADRIGYEVRVEGKTLYFKKPQEPSGQEVRLDWGMELFQFRTRSTTQLQTGKVTVRGWDFRKKAAITGQTAKGNGAPLIEDSRTGASQAQAAFGQSTVDLVTRPVHTQAEADAMAQSIMNALTGEFIQAEGVTNHGMGEILPGKWLELAGLGKRSGKYRVTASTHRYTGNEGYTTSFIVGGRRPSVVSQFWQGHAAQPGSSRINGVVVAQVSNNKDPDNLARVKVTFPWLGEKIESDWARIASPGAGNKVGLHWLPEVGDEVLVAFEHGDIHWPYVLAGLWNGKDAPPNNTSNAVGGDGKVKLRTLQSPQSSKLVISDEAQKRFVQISCVADSPGIKLDYDNKSVEILSNGTINIKGTQGKITVEGQDLEIKSSTNLKLSASANVEISAGANMTVKGVQTSVEGSAQMAVKGAMTSLEGSGIAEIKGALVKIN